MNKTALVFCFCLFARSAIAQNGYHPFYAGIEVGASLTTIQPFFEKYYGFFEDFRYGKAVNGSVGVFVNRQLSRYNRLETGFYYTTKGTHYTWKIENSRIKYKTSNSLTIRSLEIPIVWEYQANRAANLFYCYGVTIGLQLECLYSYNEKNSFNNINIAEMYKEKYFSISYGIKYKCKASRKYGQVFIRAKAEATLFPYSLPLRVEQWNYTHLDYIKFAAKQHLIGLSISLWCPFNQ